MTRAVVNRGQSEGGILARLARDVRAAALAWMCIAVIPFCGMVGGGVDIARMYITKTRLQHACDAGALAGRKQMGSGVWGSDDDLAAQRFFKANYRNGAYGTNNLTWSFRESAGKVSGTASATVPMTLMRVLGRTQETLSVTCDAEMRLPNTDIMFVLDTTGSMAQKAITSDPTSKMVSLKTAVKCFYEIVAKLDTDASCTTGTPSGGTGNEVQIRFGFMPYSTNVNVGKLLPTAYFADEWKYQSREPLWTYTTTYTYPSYTDSGSSPVPTAGTWSDYQHDSYTDTGTSKPKCVAPPSTTSVTSSTSDSAVSEANGVRTYTTTTTTTTTSKRYTSTIQQYLLFFYRCDVQVSTKVDVSKSTVTHTSQGVPTTTKTFDKWHYGQILTNIAGLKNGTSWNSSVALPIGPSGTDRFVNWDGCIEERPTVSRSDYSPIPSDAYDLNVDLVPTAGTATSLWGPALNDAIYLRAKTGNSYSTLNGNDVNTLAEYANGGSYYCPTEAKKLASWPDADAFDAYVDSLTPTGNTYHDIGMLWGARFMSPDGIFASENKFTPKGGEIDRNMIFMTDGDAQSAPCDYAAYGLPWFDKRTTSDVGPANECTATRGALNDQINARLSALCTVVKNKNITLWAISFGSGSNTATETRLSECATPGRYFVPRDSATLQATFASIANQISQLRLTQ